MLQLMYITFNLRKYFCRDDTLFVETLCEVIFLTYATFFGLQLVSEKTAILFPRDGITLQEPILYTFAMNLKLFSSSILGICIKSLKSSLLKSYLKTKSLFRKTTFDQNALSYLLHILCIWISMKKQNFFEPPYFNPSWMILRLFVCRFFFVR